MSRKVIARSPMEAARVIAERVALVKFGKTGMVHFLWPEPDDVSPGFRRCYQSVIGRRNDTRRETLVLFVYHRQPDGSYRVDPRETLSPAQIAAKKLSYPAIG
jgi:hypothetical protein